MSIKLNDKKNIKYGIVLSYLNLLVSIIGTLLVTNRVVEYIGDYNYGLFSFVNSITAWLTIISSALNASFVRFSTIEAKEKSGDSSIVNTIYFKLFLMCGSGVLFLGLGTVIILYLCHVNIGSYSWNDSGYLYLLFALSIINIAITIPSSVYTLYISYKKKFIFGKIITILTTIINFAGHFVLAYFFRDIVPICIFTIFISIFTLIFNLLYSRKILGFKFIKTTIRDNAPLVRNIFIFSGILVLNSIVDQINLSVDKTLLGFLSTPENVTYYQLGQNFDTYLIVVSLSISSMFIPTINELVINRDQQGVNDLFLKVSHAQTFAVSIVVFGFAACGMNFVNWWLGNDYEWVYFVGLTLMIIDICPLTLNSSIEIQRAENKHLFRAIVYFAVALLNIGLSVLFLYIFPSEYKILACLVGSVIARILSHWISINIYNKKVIKLPVGKYMANVLKYMVIGSVGCVFAFLANHYFYDRIKSSLLKAFIDGVIFVFIYFLLVIIGDFNFFKTILSKVIGYNTYNKLDNFFSKRKIFFKQKFKKKIKNNNKNNKPKFLFIVQRVETFSSVKTIFDNLLSSDAEVYLLPLPRYDQNNKQFDYNTYYNNYDFCKKLTTSDYILRSLNNDNQFIDYLNMNFDFVFINTPYEVAYPKIYKFKRISKYSKLCYISYGGPLIIKNDSICNIESNNTLLSNVDYIFADSLSNYTFLKKKMELCEKHTRYVYNLGFPRFDLLNKRQVNNIKTILWLPRWTTPNMKGQEPSSFLKFYHQFFKFAEEHREIRFIIRPHPLMFKTFLKEGYLKEEEYESIKEILNSNNNIFLDENSSYQKSLDEADVMLADYTSIIIEFFATTKPLIYLGNVSNVDENYEDIVNSFYSLNEWDEITNEIEELCLGIDVKYKSRITAIDNHKSEFGNGDIGKMISIFLIQEWENDFKQHKKV